MTQVEFTNDCQHVGRIKVRSGGSIVRVKPLFTYDSKFILVASGSIIKVFSIISGECVLSFKGHEHAIVSIRANKNNKLQVLSCSEDGSVIRWDYSDGKALKKYDLKSKSKITAFFAPTAEGPWYYTTMIENTDYYRVYSVIIKSSKATQITMVMRPVSPQENAVAFGPEGKFIAGIGGKTLHLHTCKSKTQKSHMIGFERLFTCVACHPTDNVVATGDTHGRVIVWSGCLDSSYPARALFHWHSSSLPDLTFSSEGSHIYSAGNEAALVKWNLHEDTKRIIPRLGAPMCAVTASPDNTYLALNHIDNALQIINSRHVVVQIIQGLTQGFCQSTQTCEKVPTGMLYDPHTRSIVMNGQPGHLQFYNVQNDKQLYQLDITGRNYISQERDSVIYNIDVEKAAVNASGLWLATVECRDDGETSLEMYLKFWQYDATSQKFRLNTNILLPHNKQICCLKFRPELLEGDSGENSTPMVVTTSDDGRFKIWMLNKGVETSWTCDLVGYYKDLYPGDACFSEDGSLLAVAFDFIVTLWTPDTNVLKANFSSSADSSPVKRVLFGRGRSSHLLVSHNESMITVWNVLTLSALWNVKCQVQCIVDDPLSDIMASFTADGNIFIFRPNHPEPVAVMQNTSSSPVISALFIPRSKFERYRKDGQCCWQSQSQLYFLNEDQVLLTVTGNDEEEEIENLTEEVTLKKAQVLTPFGMLQAEHKVTGVQPVKPEVHIFNKVDKEDEELPCPTHVNPISLCDSVLSAALEPYLRKSKMLSEDATLPHSDIDVLIEEDLLNDEEKTKAQDRNERRERMETSECDLMVHRDYGFCWIMFRDSVHYINLFLIKL